MSSPALATREAIILAGGLGTRLRGAIGDLPKPMAPVAGRPFLAWQLDALERRGVREVILSVGYRSEAIEGHFGARHGALAIRYAREDVPLGTGGAIAAALGVVRGAAAFVLNGDTYIRPPLRALESCAGCSVAMLVARVADAARFGTVLVSEGRVTGFAEKRSSGPGLVNAGVYWVAKAALAAHRRAGAFSFEKDFLEREAGRIAVGAVVTEEPFVDIGVPESLREAGARVPALAGADVGPFV
jgi:D-glycero-alpha-D-manno-heptose 1-phosphate guanylyltransferase